MVLPSSLPPTSRRPPLHVHPLSGRPDQTRPDPPRPVYQSGVVYGGRVDVVSGGTAEYTSGTHVSTGPGPSPRRGTVHPPQFPFPTGTPHHSLPRSHRPGRQSVRHGWEPRTPHAHLKERGKSQGVPTTSYRRYLLSRPGAEDGTRRDASCTVRGPRARWRGRRGPRRVPQKWLT